MEESETNPIPASGPPDGALARHLPAVLLLAVTVVGVAVCALLAAPFLSALVWALALAVVLARGHAWIEARTKRPTLAALISVGLVGVMVGVPLTWMGQRLVQEVGKGGEMIRAKVASGEWRHALEARPSLAPLADWLERQHLPATVEAVAAWLTTTGASVIKGSLVEVIGLMLTVYFLFFFLRDRREGLLWLRTLLPLPEADLTRLFHQVGDTIYATVYGTVVVSVVQGLLGGLMFWWLGLPAPLFWGLVMALLAVLPVFGAFVVWIPATLYLALEGDWGKALILALWGAAVVGTVDNLMRPLLVGRRLRVHTVVAFISVVGGLVVFGAPGFVLGPVALTVTRELLEIWHRRPAGAPAVAALPGAAPGRP